MAQTVHEILKSTGFTDEQIAALDARAITAFTGVLSTAEQAQVAAATASAKAESERQAAQAALEANELVKRSNTEFYETKIIPGITGWEEERNRLLAEKTNNDALVAFYKAQNEGARTAGFVPADAPVFTPPAPVLPRAGNGQFVAPGATPGNPTFTMEDVRNGLGSTMGTLADIQWKHEQLYGKPMPVSPTELVRQAEARKLDPATYAATTFNFQAREQELAAQKTKAEQDALRAEIVAAKDKEYADKEAALRAEFAVKERSFAERSGNNGDVRPAVAAKMTEIRRAVENKERPDPLKMNDRERRTATRNAIHSEIEQPAVA